MLKTRIKKIRTEKHLSMERFGERIGITRSSVCKLENGENNPSEQTIRLICQEFSINEHWLRTGEGEPAIKRTRNQEIGAFANEVMSLPDENIKKRLIEALIKLDERDWETIEKIVDNLKEGN